MLQEMQLPKTRAEAKILGVGYYFTGAVCLRGHKSKRVLNGTCYACMLGKLRVWNKTEAAKRASKKYYEGHKQLKGRVVSERKKAQIAGEKRYLTGRPCLKGHVDYRYTHGGSCAECVRISARPRSRKRYAEKGSDYWRRDKAVVNAHCVKRRTAQEQACPAWLSKQQHEEIKQKYVEAHRLSKLTGVKYSVDHIVPLHGRTVRGLHVPWNLRVMTFSDNAKKHNHLVSSDCA